MNECSAIAFLSSEGWGTWHADGCIRVLSTILTDMWTQIICTSNSTYRFRLSRINPVKGRYDVPMTQYNPERVQPGKSSVCSFFFFFKILNDIIYICKTAVSVCVFAFYRLHAYPGAVL